MTSKDNNDIVVKILENYTVRIESALSKTQNEVSEIHSEIRTLQNDVTSLKSDNVHLQTSIYWGFAIIAIVIALVGFTVSLAPAFLEFLKNKKTYATVEQVQEIVDRAIARAFSSINK